MVLYSTRIMFQKNAFSLSTTFTIGVVEYTASELVGALKEIRIYGFSARINVDYILKETVEKYT